MNQILSSQARTGVRPTHAPNAALLIDFDNVTLGIRSDLTKELKSLLSSDIIKGKVAVQRAYADWRRYPQYIVPLSESSIDLIFAPAFGTNKKNATDIRLAIDAIELVFTRPEIGTFILLSGDSDFSTMVIKLKEYGKYVIGVGLRESASDLLIQNCDEYYSYSDLAGLSREDDRPSAQRDPWELVTEAVTQMIRRNDVMRSDRLKQVMQQIDPNFDEHNAGFNRFSKFIVEAGNRGLVKVQKLENGQYEIAPVAGGTGAGTAAAPAPEAKPEGRESSRRGRGRRGGRGRDRGEKAERVETVETAETEAKAPEATAKRATPGRSGGRQDLSLAQAFDLLRRALEELPRPTTDDALRNRMSALYGRHDVLLEGERFERLIRQAHDAEIIDLAKGAEGGFSVTQRGVAPTPQARTAPEASSGPATDGKVSLDTATRGRLGFRRGSRTGMRSAEVQLVGVVDLGEEGGPAKEEKAVDSGKKETGSRTTRKKATKRTKKTGTKKATSRKKSASRKAASSGSGESAADPKDETKAASEKEAKPRKRRPRRKSTKSTAKSAGDGE